MSNNGGKGSWNEQQVALLMEIFLGRGLDVADASKDSICSFSFSSFLFYELLFFSFQDMQ